MAAPALRIVRRPKRALTAASAPVTNQRTIRTTLAGVAGRNRWQLQAWKRYREVGEFRYYVGWRSQACSRVRLVASDIDPDTGLPTGSTDNQLLKQIVRAIAGGPLGQAQFIKRAVEVLSVPGEFWTAVIHPGGVERWLVITEAEMHSTPGDKTEIDLPEGGRYELNFPTDSLFRVWLPDAERAQDASSPAQAVDDSMDEIVRTTRKIRHADYSRMVNAGILWVPQEMSLPPVNPPTAEGLMIAPQGVAAVQQLADRLWDSAKVARDDEMSYDALIPHIATVPSEYIGQVALTRFDNDVTDVALKTREAAISRLALGLDVNPERLKGLGAESNHWSAWQVADEDVQLHISPVMETICQAVYQQMVAPLLAAVNLRPEQFIMWYDTSELTADPDKSDDAEAAFTAGTIRSDAYREYKDLDADSGYELPGIEDPVVAWAWDRLSQHPELLPVLAPLLPEPYASMVAEANTPPPAPVLPPDQIDTGAPQQEPQTEQNPAQPAPVPLAAAMRRP